MLISEFYPAVMQLTKHSVKATTRDLKKTVVMPEAYMIEVFKPELLNIVQIFTTYMKVPLLLHMTKMCFSTIQNYMLMLSFP